MPSRLSAHSSPFHVSLIVRPTTSPHLILNPSLRTVKKMGKAFMVLQCRQRRETEKRTGDSFPGSHPAFSSNTYGTFWLPEAPSPFVSSNHIRGQKFTFCPPYQCSHPVQLTSGLVHFRSSSLPVCWTKAYPVLTVRECKAHFGFAEAKFTSYSRM